MYKIYDFSTKLYYKKISLAFLWTPFKTEATTLNTYEEAQALIKEWAVFSTNDYRIIPIKPAKAKICT